MQRRRVNARVDGGIHCHTCNRTPSLPVDPCMFGQLRKCKTDVYQGLEWDNPDRPECTNLLTIYQVSEPSGGGVSQFHIVAYCCSSRAVHVGFCVAAPQLVATVLCEERPHGQTVLRRSWRSLHTPTMGGTPQCVAYAVVVFCWRHRL